MKPILLLSLLLYLLLSNNALLAQDQLDFQCHTIHESISDEDQQLLRTSTNTPCDEDAIDFESIPEIVLKVRFHYLRDINGNHNFQESVGDDVANTILSMANDKLSTNPPLTLYYGDSPPPNFQKKMRYKLAPTSGEPDDTNGDGIFYHNTDTEWIYCPKIDNENSPCGNNYTSTPSITYQAQSDVIDIYIIAYHPDFINYYQDQGIDEYPRFYNRGIADGLGQGHAVTLTSLYAKYTILGEEWSAQNSTAQILNHEIGHLLNLHHPRWDGCDDIPIGNPAWCGANASNNTMDYNCTQDALSPCQLYKIHELVYSENVEYHDQEECFNSFTPSFSMIYNNDNHTIKLEPDNYDFEIWTPVWEINAGEKFYYITDINPEITLYPNSSTSVSACLRLYKISEECYSKEYCQSETYDELQACIIQCEIVFGDFESEYNSNPDLSSLELIPPSTGMSYQFSVNVTGSDGNAYINNNCSENPLLVFDNSIIYDGGTIEICMTCFGDGCYSTVCKNVEIPECNNESGYFSDGTANYSWGLYSGFSTEAPSNWQHYWTIDSENYNWEINDPNNSSPTFRFGPEVKFFGDIIEICHVAFDPENYCFTDNYCEVIIVPPAPICIIDATFELGEFDVTNLSAIAKPTGFNFLNLHYWTINSASGSWYLDNPTNVIQTFNFDQSVFIEGDTVNICHYSFGFFQGCYNYHCEEFIIPPLDDCASNTAIDFEYRTNIYDFPCSYPGYALPSGPSLIISAEPITQNENYIFNWELNVQPEGDYFLNTSNIDDAIFLTISSEYEIFTNLEICLSAIDSIENCLTEKVCHEIYNCEEDTLLCHTIKEINFWTEFDEDEGQHLLKGDIPGYFAYLPQLDFEVTITINGETTTADYNEWNYLNPVFTTKYEKGGLAEICITVKESSTFCQDTICITLELPDPDPVIEVDLLCAMQICPDFWFGVNLVSDISGVNVIYDFGDQSQLIVTEVNGQMPSVIHQYSNPGWFYACVSVIHPLTSEVLAQDCKWTYVPKWCVKNNIWTNEELVEFAAYPNPSDGENLTIRFNDVVKTERLNIKVVSAIGVLAYETNFNRFDDYIIELNNLNLANGQHYISITDALGNNFGQSITVIRQR